MAQPITIPILQDPVYLADDRFEVEIDSTIQDDRVFPWGPERRRRGYGYGSPSTTGYGHGRGLPYGQGVYGAGLYGKGMGQVEHQPIDAAVAEDYSVRLRAIDVAGNVGSWSTAAPIEHRPTPPAPTELGVDGSTMTWTWSDP